MCVWGGGGEVFVQSSKEGAEDLKLSGGRLEGHSYYII